MRLPRPGGYRPVWFFFGALDDGTYRVIDIFADNGQLVDNPEKKVTVGVP